MSDNANFINELIKAALPKINKGIQTAIKSAHLDPWGQIAHGSENLGSIDLGICTATAEASYTIGNMTGLSSFKIDSLTVSSFHKEDGDSKEKSGTMTLEASFGSDLSAHAGGELEAKCGPLHHSVEVGATAAISGVKGGTTGSFTCTLKLFGDSCLNSVTVSNLSIEFGNVKVKMDGSLGIFDPYLNELISAIEGSIKDQVLGAIEAALKSIINSEIGKVLPLCGKLKL